jgi:glycosyltransferase involved in cell wall biosynthesis
MKRVLVDLYKVKRIYSGLGQFSLNFANELIRQSQDEFNIIFLTPANFEFEKIQRFESVKANFQKRYLPALNQPYEIWHGLQQFPSHFPKKNSKFILTVHDLNFLYEKSGLKRLKYLRRLQKNVDKADYVTAISNYTRKNLEDNINLRGKTVLTIYNGINVDSEGISIKPAYISGRKFFFSIGIFNEKKNFHVLLSIMKYFKDYYLIIAGNNDTAYGSKIRQQISAMKLEDRVILPGNVTPGERLWLYSNCDGFLFPSLAEGFGMPVIEAMRFGKPVFLSKFTSLPEIGGEYAYYFDSFDEGYMSSFIDSGLKSYRDNQIYLSDRIKEHAETFSWQKSIRQYLKLYREISDNIDGPK